MPKKLNKHKTSWWAESSYEHFIESAKRNHKGTTRQKGRVRVQGPMGIELWKSSDNNRATPATATRDDAEAA